MAFRNPWIVPIAILILMAILMVVVLGSAAIRLVSAPRPQVINVLHVPLNYPTIQAAIDAAAPGDVIQVAGGTYNENLMLNKAVSLTAESLDPINPANNNVILDGNKGAAAIVIPGGLTQMPSIRGFAIRNSANGIQAHSEFIAENDYFYGSTTSVDYELGSGGANRSNLYFNSGDDAIHVADINRPLLIENNRIMYAGNDAIEIGLQAASVPASMNEVDIWNNMLIGSREDGIKFVDLATNPQDANRRFVIVGNLIANNRRAGIGLMSNPNTTEDYSGADTAEAVRVYNNTLYGNDYGISGGDNLVAFNNIIANTVSRGAWRVQGATGANSVIAYTLFFGNRVDTDQTTLGPGDIFGLDPLFMAAPTPGPDGAWGTVDDDFSGLLLQPGSPAIDKGVTQYAASNGEPVPPTPITGFAGVAPDLGWREFGSPVFITPTPIGTLLVTPTLPATALPSPTPLASQTPIIAASATTAPPTSTPGSPTQPSPTAPAGSPTAAATNTPGMTATPQAGVSILGISPVSATTGATVNVTVSGAGFQGGATVSFEGGQGTAPQVTGVQVLSPTTLAMTVKVPDDASGTQVWNVRVTNPDGSSTVLNNAFTVNP